MNEQDKTEPVKPSGPAPWGGESVCHIRIEHDGGNVVGGPIGHVLESHLVRGWSLIEVRPSLEPVKPSREDVARLIDPAVWACDDDCNTCRAGRPSSLRRADAVLALFPGRTVTEVKAEARREAGAEIAAIVKKSIDRGDS